MNAQFGRLLTRRLAAGGGNRWRFLGGRRHINCQRHIRLRNGSDCLLKTLAVVFVVKRTMARVQMECPVPPVARDQLAMRGDTLGQTGQAQLIKQPQPLGRQTAGRWQITEFITGFVNSSLSQYIVDSGCQSAMY